MLTFAEERAQRIINGDEPYIILNDEDWWPIPFKMVKGHIVFTDEEEQGQTLDDVLFESIEVTTYTLSHHCYTTRGELRKQYVAAKEQIDAAIAKLKHDLMDGAIHDGEACPNCRKYWKLDDWHYCPWCGTKIPNY